MSKCMPTGGTYATVSRVYRLQLYRVRKNGTQLRWKSDRKSYLIGNRMWLMKLLLLFTIINFIIIIIKLF